MGDHRPNYLAPRDCWIGFLEVLFSLFVILTRVKLQQFLFIQNQLKFQKVKFVWIRQMAKKAQKNLNMKFLLELLT